MSVPACEQKDIVAKMAVIKYFISLYPQYFY